MAAAICAAIALAHTPAPGQVVVLDDGFESYAIGLLGSQGGWTCPLGAGPGPSVVASPVKTGARALLVRCDVPGYPVPATPQAMFELPIYSSLGRLEVDAMKETSNHDYLNIGLRHGPDGVTSTAACDLYFSNNGEIRWWGAAYPFTPLTIPAAYNPGQWYRIRIDWYPTSTADIYVDGVLSASGFPFALAAPGGINWARLASGASDDGPGSNVENAWFDNAKVTLFDFTPVAVAPSTWGALKITYR